MCKERWRCKILDCPPDCKRQYDFDCDICMFDMPGQGEEECLYFTGQTQCLDEIDGRWIFRKEEE